MKKIKLASILLFWGIVHINAMAQSHNLIQRELNQAELPANNLHVYKNAIQTKYVQINLNELNTEDIFRLSLFNQTNFEFKFYKQYIYTIGSESWYGKSIDKNGDAIFSFYKGYINGMIVDDLHRKYIVQQINKSDLFAITQVDNEGMQESAADQIDYIDIQNSPKKTRANADVCAAGTDCGAASTIDLMVLGAAAAIANGGGTVASFTANVTSAVTEMNTAYANSGGTNLTFNLIHCDATTFSTTSDMSADLTNFSSDAGIQALRNTHHADLVGLWAGSGNYAGFCGLGYLNSNPTNYSDNSAYTVTDYGCGMTNLSFAHECGHNMGFQHDYYVASSTLPCAHHHGYVNQAVIPSGLPTTARWRTIMAYNNHCSDNGFFCTRLARWANPSSTYLGSPTGIAIGSPQPSNEIYGLERVRCVVAGFRANPLPVNLLSFEGQVSDRSILLNWKTSDEVNNKGFEIQFKRNDMSDYKTADFVMAKTGSSLINTYEYTLKNLVPAQYTLRLKQVDIDNKFSYSNEIQLNIISDKLQAVLYPNPNQGYSHVSIYNPQSQRVTVELYDVLGKQLRTVFNDNSKQGPLNMNISTDSLGRGSYYIVVRAGNEKQVVNMIVE